MIKRQLYLVPFICCLLLCQVTSAQLTAAFTATPTSGCVPIRVVFQDQSTGNPTSWKWDLGIGAPIVGVQNPSTTYFASGFYTIKLTVYNGQDSSTITKTNYISVFAVPDVNFDANPKVGCFPMDVNFTDLSNAGSGTITSWQWDFGDGNISNLQNPSHTYLNTGLFNVTLTVKNSNGCTKTLNKVNLINVSPGVIAGFTNTMPVTCVFPVTINFTNTSSGIINSYFWDFGDGFTSALPNPSHTYISPGIYTVTLTVTNSSGCTKTIVKTNLLRIGVVTADFNAPAVICAGTAFTLLNTSAPQGSLISSVWNFGDGTSSNAIHPIKTYPSPGTYTITLTSNFGTCQNTTSNIITVNPRPVASFTATNTGACQPPLTTTFTNTSAGGTVVSWNFGDGQTSIAANPSHTYTTSGSFPVTLIIQNSSGCYDTLRRPAFVIVAPPDITAITPLLAEGCIPFTVNFSPVIVTPEPIVSYEWDFGNGITSTGPNPSHTYTVQGTYIIKLKVTSASGCTDTISYRPGVRVGQKPLAAFSATPRIACARDIIHFTDLSIAPLPDRWFWTFGDGGSSTQQNPEYNYNDTGYFTVTLVTWHNGCSDTARIPRYIYINPPIAAFRDSFDCSNQKLHYFTNQSIGAQHFEWTFGDGTTDTMPNPTHLYADTGRYQVRLTVRNQTCVHDASKIIIVLDEKAGFNVSDSVGCKSTVKEFTPTGNGWNILEYTWDFGDGSTGFDTVSAFIRHRYTATGTYNVKLKITDLNGCPDTITKPVVVNQYGPKADFGPFQKVCIHALAGFTDLSRADTINNIVQWTWDFGDNTGPQTFNAPPFTHVYDTAGTFSVRLIVKDASGCSDTLLKLFNIRVNDPKANFVSADTIVCRGSPVVLLSQSAGSIVSWLWDLGDGTTSANINPTHSYPLEGTYTIKLAITDDAGCRDSITKPQYIRVFDARAAFAMNDSFTTCPPLFVSFTNQSVNGYTGQWDFGDNNTSTLYNPSHTYTQSGVFNVILRVTGNGGCKDSATRQIRILGPTGSFTYNPILGCIPLQVNFTSSAQNTYFYTFDFNDGVTQFSSNSGTTHSYTLPGNYLPKIILEDSLGCKLPIFGTDTIRVKSIRSYIKALTTYLICDSAIVQFNDSTITNDVVQSYLWNFGDGFTSGLQNPAHKYSIAGLYRVTLRVVTVTGCTSVDTLQVLIKVTPAPRISIAGDAQGCVPKQVQYTGQWLNQDTSTITWRWDFGNGQQSAIQNPQSVMYTQPGLFQATLIARNASGCADTFVHPIRIFALPLINAGPDKFICRGNNDTLSASGGFSYTWDAHPSLSCTNCSRPLANPDSTRTYIVRGTDTNSCKNIDTVLVRVKQPFNLSVDPGDTLCVGQSFKMQAYGAENYIWESSQFLNANNIPNPISRPDNTITYRVTGYDSVGCFRDTGFVTIKVYPIPTVNIIENQVSVQVGDPVQFHTVSSPDVTRWRWTPGLTLTCADCANPIAYPRQSMSYVLTVTNDGNCTAQDRVNITLLCKEGNIYVPNTFSPNNDGQNDIFYPRGKGIFSMKSMRIFNRWGEQVFEKTNFNANDPAAGWDGTHKGILLTPDVYVYIMEVVCDNNFIYSVKGNVTLLR